MKWPMKDDAYGRYAYRMVSVRSTPMRDTPMGMVYWRCMSIKVIIVEKGF